MKWCLYRNGSIHCLGLRELNQEAFIIITAYTVGRLFDERHLHGSGRLLGHFLQYAPSQRRINMLYQEMENPHFHSQNTVNTK